MPFEPRLFRDDDSLRLPAGTRAEPGDARHGIDFDDAALELPADLAALSQQLVEDADHLAGRYPAAPYPAAPYPAAPAAEAAIELASSSNKRRRFLRWGGAAAALLLTIGGWQFVESRMADHGRLHAALPVTPLAALNPAVIVPKRVATERALPASVFRGLTGAEQEAVLDLMQDDPHQRGELSI